MDKLNEWFNLKAPGICIDKAENFYEKNEQEILHNLTEMLIEKKSIYISGNYPHQLSTVLNFLGYQRIFSIERNNQNNMVLLTECCDQYFEVSLTKKLLYFLIQELKRIHDKMKD